ncbi:MAG: WG repeat-containing protein [Saprospiraceae bacterium]|nr:WG repeat-containing protein [Saprospiraceae bacterium]
MTFYHALTGKAPYDSTTDSDYEIHTKIVNEDLDLSRVSVSWASTLRPMLVKDPADRVTIKEVGGKAGNQKSDDGTQYDDPEPPKPIPNPKPTPASTSLSVPQWVYYLIGGIALAVAFMMGVRSGGSGEEITTGLLVYEEGNMYGYKDSKGTVVIPARYETAKPFSDGRALVMVADSVYYIDENGTISRWLSRQHSPMRHNQNY